MKKKSKIINKYKNLNKKKPYQNIINKYIFRIQKNQI